MGNYAIIAAGGKGTRINSEIPKQYISINNKPIIAYSLQTFQECDEIDQIIIAADKSYFNLLQKIKNKFRFDKLVDFIEAGNSRQQSVFNAFSSLSAQDNDLVAVHDAARPFLSQTTLSTALKNAERFDNVVVALKAKDTLFKGSDFVENFLDREKIYFAQTPQIFRYLTLKKAFDAAMKDKFLGTDESTLVKRIGEQVYISEGSFRNFKVTTNDDLKIAEDFLKKTN